MNRYRALFAALLLALPVAGLRTEEPAKVEAAKVPFEINRNRHQIVQAKINGKEVPTGPVAGRLREMVEGPSPAQE